MKRFVVETFSLRRHVDSSGAPRSLSTLLPDLGLARRARVDGGGERRGGAIAPVQPLGTYSCTRPRSSGGKPPPTAGQLYGAPALPGGTVPVARISREEARSVPPGPPGAGTKALLGTNYQYAFDKAKSPGKNLNYLGMRATTTVAQPAVGAADFHSLGQLWLLDEFESTFSDVELGWTVDPGLNGDSKPHLFSFTFDKGTPGCYNGACGSYVQVSETTFPGMLLSSGASLKLEVRRGTRQLVVGRQRGLDRLLQTGQLDPPRAGGTRRVRGGRGDRLQRRVALRRHGQRLLPDRNSGTTFWQVALAQFTFSGWKYVDVSRNLIATDEFGWRAIKSTKDSTAFNYGGPGYC